MDAEVDRSRSECDTSTPPRVRVLHLNGAVRSLSPIAWYLDTVPRIVANSLSPRHPWTILLSRRSFVCEFGQSLFDAGTCANTSGQGRYLVRLFYERERAVHERLGTLGNVRNCNRL